jgi:DNA-binding GntR family transcriptional regulator
MTSLRGEQNGNSKMTADIVRKLRKAAKLRRKLSNKALAARYGVSVDGVRNVLKGARWSHVK